MNIAGGVGLSRGSVGDDTGSSWRRWKPRRRRLPCRPRSEGGKHPGVPDDKAQRNSTDAESRFIPAPVGKDNLQAYNC